jgi:hypothetical protein
MLPEVRRQRPSSGHERADELLRGTSDLNGRAPGLAGSNSPWNPRSTRVATPPAPSATPRPDSQSNPSPWQLPGQRQATPHRASRTP